jgi:hypothetical protein
MTSLHALRSETSHSMISARCASVVRCDVVGEPAVLPDMAVDKSRPHPPCIDLHDLGGAHLVLLSDLAGQFFLIATSRHDVAIGRVHHHPGRWACLS